jgi:hypothetical protein
LTLRLGDQGYVIELDNHRVSLRPDDLGEDGVGRDFAWFYQLVKNPPAWSQRLIPHVKYTRWKSAKDVAVPECNFEPQKDPTSRPICPMGSINPGEDTP